MVTLVICIDKNILIPIRLLHILWSVAFRKTIAVQNQYDDFRQSSEN
jgi:hypothetical protein